ncbi:SUMO activating enzyme subunit 1 [Trichuris trichiura]|uniref:SUMO activating enzyme subunit 1 n=1 Tax=Trichuris trichiura TaxID=36087 RepID=A0A077Z706_TRITR|nr:SUMO activating enzyme subunit 1 [Trichuris trichiura]
MEAAHSNEKSLSKQEAVLYDRQIRIWGFKGQSRIMKSDVLLVGLGALGAESAKNLLLAGIRRLTLLDTAIVTEADVNQSILLTPDCVGKQRAAASLEACKSMNSFVEVDALDKPVDSLCEEDIAPYTIVILTDQSQPACNRACKLCRKLKIHFCSLSLYGTYAYGILDFQKECENITSREVPEVPLPDAEDVNGEVLQNGKMGELKVVTSESPASEAEFRSHQLRRLKNCLLAICSVLAFEKSAGRRWSPKDAQVLVSSTKEGEAGLSLGSELISRLSLTSIVPIPIISGIICGEITNVITVVMIDRIPD